MAAEIISKIVVWAATALLGALTTYFAMKYKATKRENDAVKKGMQSLLRNSIIEKHDRYMEKGFAPVYAKEALTKSYEAYHDLGGNGVVTKLYNDVIALPEEEQER